ncbi:hypothetical protein Tsubulata_027426 [Turnera subulata]|uniref:Uncharacterized protein n=1 Tax=Turnera subulata TaxID=218843 RepID=A0A9Q0JL49_9ROSI|nr:hypothetical protein Tsubulata_027426 [Turnera subulata]
MHDMLRELAVSKSEEEKFCALYDERIGSIAEEGVIRRLSIQSSWGEIKPWDAIAQLWSFHLFVNEDISETQVEALPNGFLKLKNLKYLLSNRWNDATYYDFIFVVGTRFPPKLNCLNNLHFLGYVEANSFVVKENMSLLRRLFVKAAKEDQILRLDALKSPPPFLQRLTLVGKLENIP